MIPKKRLEAVETALRQESWTEQVITDLMVATGASRPTIYRDRAKVLRKLAAEEAEGLEERRAGFLLDLRRVQQEARIEKDYGPVARLLDMEAKILGLDRVPLPALEEVEGPVDTSFEAVLADVRRLRKRAVAGDSYVAAEKLLEREVSIVESIRLRDQALADANLDHLSEDEKVELAAELLRGLPDPLRRKVLAAVGL